MRYSSVHHREGGVSRSDLRGAQGQVAMQDKTVKIAKMPEKAFLGRSYLRNADTCRLLVSTSCAQNDTIYRRSTHREAIGANGRYGFLGGRGGSHTFSPAVLDCKVGFKTYLRLPTRAILVRPRLGHFRADTMSSMAPMQTHGDSGPCDPTPGADVIIRTSSRDLPLRPRARPPGRPDPRALPR